MSYVYEVAGKNEVLGKIIRLLKTQLIFLVSCRFTLCCTGNKRFGPAVAGGGEVN